MLKAFKRIDFKDRLLFQFQENVGQFLGQLNGKILGGNEVKDVVIGTSTTLVPHELARSYQGWHLLDIQGDARVWRDTTSTADNTKFLPLKASASVTVSLWVF